MNKSFVILLSLIVSQFVLAQNYKPTWESLDARPIPEWFEDAKFGIFIHWGLYSVPAWAPTGNSLGVYDKYAEWYGHRIGINPTKDKELMRVCNLFKEHHKQTWGDKFNYQNFASLWKAENFNPDEWAELIKKAGAKYVVLTSKHHDGFTLWPSKESWNWNSVDMGPQRDICDELNNSVRKEGLRMGYYYSLYEWFNPLYLNNVDRYVETRMIPQLKDLVMRYSPDIIWTDGAWDHSDETWKSKEYLTWLYNESPVKESVVVNDRWGKSTRGKHGGYYTTEYGLLSEHKMADSKFHKPFEECRGIGGSFGYNQNETLDDYMTTEKLIHLLVEKVSNGGNLLLNIGPTADGRIPVIMQQRLMDVGNWLVTNGEAIYGTRYWDFSENQIPNESLHFTKKNDNLYAIVTKWPSNSIVINNVERVQRIELLGSKTTIKFKQKGDVITIFVPECDPNNFKSNHAWVFKLIGAVQPKGN